MTIESIFRAEWPDGRGVYQNHCGQYRLIDNDGYQISAAQEVGMITDRLVRQPEPHKDPKLKNVWLNLDGMRKLSFRFCFASLALAGRWFHKELWLMRLDDLGVVLSEYHVETQHVHHGVFQSIFYYPKATKVNSKKMITLQTYIKKPIR